MTLKTIDKLEISKVANAGAETRETRQRFSVDFPATC